MLRIHLEVEELFRVHALTQLGTGIRSDGEMHIAKLPPGGCAEQTHLIHKHRDSEGK